MTALSEDSEMVAYNAKQYYPGGAKGQIYLNSVSEYIQLSSYLDGSVAIMPSRLVFTVYKGHSSKTQVHCLEFPRRAGKELCWKLWRPTAHQGNVGKCYDRV